jgi:heme oxygenase
MKNMVVELNCMQGDKLMQHTSEKTISQINLSQFFAELEKMAELVANDLRKPLLNANRNNYIHFLNMMYHFTLPSEAVLKRAAELSHTKELREYFLHMAKEERGHYVLAQEDLRGFGLEPSKETPEEMIILSKAVDELHARDNICAYLGAIFLCENVAKHLQKEGREMLQKLDLNKKQSRWVAVHLEADLEHGEEIKEICGKYVDTYGHDIIDGAKTIYKPWLNLFRSGLTKTL